MPLRMKIQSININSHVLDRLHHADTTNITTSKTSQATHTRLSPMPSPSLQHCLFHQTFPYNNNKNSNIIKNKYAECSHGRIPQVVPKNNSNK
ncbi:hypothetical protein Bca4012_089910 [Brassica carinata]